MGWKRARSWVREGVSDVPAESDLGRVVMVGSALEWGAWALGQERVKVEVTVPAVPNIGTVEPG